MNRIPMLSVALLAMSCGGCGGDSGSPASPAVAPQDFTPVGTTLDAFISKFPVAPSGLVTGYGFAVTSASGLVYEKAGGNQDVTTVIAIASATKVPSAIAILTLVDAGKLNLDEPVKTYFDALDPGFDWPQDKWPITVRMLLSHTAGLPQPPDPTSSDCLSNTVTTLQQCVQDIATHSLLYAPGTTFSYSGADYQVAGYITELLTGTDWESYFVASVAAPLKLTTFTYGNTDNPRVAGGGSSNIEDYATILRMILNDGVADDGTRVLSDTMIKELLKDQVASDTFVALPFLAADQQAYFLPAYTFGFFITTPALYALTGSPGPEYDDPGSFGTTPWLDTGAGYAAVILISQDVTTGLSIWNAVRPEIASQFVH